MSEPWPDPDDIADWLAALEAGIKLLDEQRAAAQARLDDCRRAVLAPDALVAGSEASKRLCLLMHGGCVEPANIDADEVALVAPLWTPPTDEARRATQLAKNKRDRERGLEEARRRIALAERITGTRYEGVPIEELRPSLKALRSS